MFVLFFFWYFFLRFAYDNKYTLQIFNMTKRGRITMSQNNKCLVYLLILLRCYLYSKYAKIGGSVQENILEFKFYVIFGEGGVCFVLETPR